MPGLKPGEMNGHSDYSRFGPDRGYTNGNFDPYGRDDPYRDEMKGEEDLYRRPVRNGGARPTASDRFNSDHLADQNSLSDFNSAEPAFELDHLATFAAGDVRKGTMHVEDGLRKLRQMENTTGIWTMRCILLVERRFLVILDKNSGEELERFPVHMIHEPTAVFKNDRREIYNNLVLFTVMDDSNKKDPHADMHIFQSVRTPAQNIVDEIFASKRGQGRVSSAGYKIPPQPAGPAPDPYDFEGFQETGIEQRRFNQQRSSQYGASQFSNGGGLLGGQRSSMMARPSYSPYREREDDYGNNELLERDVQLLNHCFDDIEKFVARLQQAAEAYKELERRKRERGGKGKKPMGGDGMLGHRARPPPSQDFVDIFQKFKLSFNLMAKMKAHMHDPNAPELVHFLFTPLSLIYEASRDPIHGSVNLGEQAVAPVLTPDAKQLLLHCLTSKEIELWQALGKNWTTSKDEWKGYIPPYVPRFYDGWQPAPTLVEEPAPRANLESAVAAHHTQIINRQREQDVREYVRDRVMPFPPEEERFPRDPRAQDYQRFEPDLRVPSPPREAMSNPPVAGYQEYVEQHIHRNYHANNRRAPEPVSQPPPPVSQPPKQPPLDDNTAYFEELKKTHAKVYEVLHDRQGKNAKELTVNKGDYLQVLDSNRNWWKVRNYKGQSGYCPYTILKEVTYSADNARDQGGTDAGSAPPPSDRGGNKRELFSEELETQFASNPSMLPRYEKPREASSPRHFDVVDALTVEEEEAERHAFRPVEPPVYSSKVIGGIRPTQPQIDLHNELRSKMGRGSHRQQGGEERRYTPDTYYQPPNPPASVATSSPPDSTAGAQAFYITRASSQADVASWLDSKGFSTLCRTTLQGFTGRDLFSLQRQEIAQLIGHDEAARLEGQLTLQKKMTGYKTQSAAELNAIFQKRRERSNLQGTSLGQPPDFRPQTPSSYDGPDSDSDSGDRQLAETGKTLRDLLIRQRQKIIDSSVFDQHL